MCTVSDGQCTLLTLTKLTGLFTDASPSITGSTLKTLVEYWNMS